MNTFVNKKRRDVKNQCVCVCVCACACVREVWTLRTVTLHLGFGQI